MSRASRRARPLHHLALALALPLGATGCGDGGIGSAEAAALAAADQDLAAGHLDAAKTRLELLLADAPGAVARTRAQLGLARVRAVELRFERSMQALEALGSELAERPSPEAARALDEVVAATAQQPRHDEIATAADRIRRQATTAAAAKRAAEVESIDDLVRDEELGAALLLARELESRRPAGDAADIRAALDRAAAESTRLARECIAALPDDAAAALARLDERIAAYAGTPGAVELVVERVRRGGFDLKRAPPAAGENSTSRKDG